MMSGHAGSSARAGRRILSRPMSMSLPTRPRFRLIATALALALAAVGTPAGSLAATRGPATSAAAPVIDAARPYTLNLAGPGDFVAQTNFVQCVGASVQMMLNMVQPGADRSAATQLELQRLARAWSGPRPDGTEREGAGVAGWAASLVIRRAGAYRIVAADTLDEAMAIAAEAIWTYHRPVGLLVWRGRHAWVMSGFEAATDPARSGGIRVTKAYILDPLYPHGSATWGPSPKPGAAIPVATVGRQFLARRTGGPWNALPGSRRLAGKYVLVVPSGPIRPGID
jgi:hypothetical protein